VLYLDYKNANLLKIPLAHCCRFEKTLLLICPTRVGGTGGNQHVLFTRLCIVEYV